MPAPIEENKSLVRRFFDAVLRDDPTVFDEIVAPDYNDHLAVQSPGRENLKQYFAGLRSAFPDLELPIMHMVAEGDKVAVLNAVRGTQEGKYEGLHATGNRIDATAFQLYRIENGRLAEHWEIPDNATITR
jgi:predicted ester cyclase